MPFVLFQYPRSDRRRCNKWYGVQNALRTESFSILGRIGGDATHIIATANPPEMIGLSVSSVGSEAMQPGVLWRLFYVSAVAFSILGRIGGDATRRRRSRQRDGRIDFQYPRSDRRRCNNKTLGGPTIRIPPFSILGRIGGDATRPQPGQGVTRPRLSVSSVGSEAMQQREIDNDNREGIIPFSILGRIGGDATPTTPTPTPAPWSLSVSSVGSEAMQPFRPLAYFPPYFIFQYPRSDRRRCNQQGSLHSRTSEQTFSILGRIGGDATTRRGGDCRTGADLSVSSVGSEAMQPVYALARQMEAKLFQYPRSDRRRCNFFRDAGKYQVYLAFSILGRIGGDATWLILAIVAAIAILSVSSVGSEAMQLWGVRKWRAAS